MAGVRCSVCNKFYNPEKFSDCPFCKSDSVSIRGSKEELSQPIVLPSKSKDSEIDILLEKALEKSPDNEGKTVSFFGGFVNDGMQNSGYENENVFFSEETENNEINLMNADDGAYFEELVSQNKDVPQVNKEKAEVSSTGPETEKEKISNTAASGDGKTWGYFKSLKSEMSSSNAQEQPQKYIRKTGRPVVGWLVCVKGIHFGESFEFFEGNNSLGRFPENDIVISDDRSVSRDSHIFIIFDAKKGDYYIKPGTSHSIPRLNDNPVLEVMSLSEKDVIEVGEENFVFIPLCGKEFDWQKYINPEE